VLEPYHRRAYASDAIGLEVVLLTDAVSTRFVPYILRVVVDHKHEQS